jgi:hypothetical protein
MNRSTTTPSHVIVVLITSVKNITLCSDIHGDDVLGRESQLLSLTFLCPDIDSCDGLGHDS